MHESLLNKLLCPVCRQPNLKLKQFISDENLDTVWGMVYCLKCGNWYPIEDYLLELLPPGISYDDDRHIFANRFSKQMIKNGQAERAQVRKQNPQLNQQKHFDWYAENPVQSYSDYAASVFWRNVDQLVFSRWKPYLNRHDWLLDIGCGQGRSTFMLAEQPVNIIAFDISKKMVRQAIIRNKKNHYRAKIHFLVADATNLPFVNGSFDHALSYGVLHHLPDPRRGCREIIRILNQKGGNFFLLENNKSAFRIIFDTMQRINPLWYEEAGAAPLMSNKDIILWFGNSRPHLQTRTITFFPPHLVSMLSEKNARLTLQRSDNICGSIPWLSNQGGLIEIIGTIGKKIKRN